jgi:hypothetical protein
MKARVINSVGSVSIPNSCYTYGLDSTKYQMFPSECKQDIMVYGKDIEFEIKMISKNGFYLPLDSDVDVEIKFTVIPKPQLPIIKTFK